MQFLKKVTVVFLIIKAGLFFRAELNCAQLNNEQITQLTQLFYTSDVQEALREKDRDKVEKIIVEELCNEAQASSFASLLSFELVRDSIWFIGAFLGAWYFFEKRERGKSMNINKESKALPV